MSVVTDYVPVGCGLALLWVTFVLPLVRSHGCLSSTLCGHCPSFTVTVAHSCGFINAVHIRGHPIYCATTRQSPPVSGNTDRVTHKILNRDPKDEILKAFRLFDDDETGKISFKNLKRVAKELGERMTDEELQEMIDEADRDGDGEVNEEEFLRIMKKTNLF